MKRLPAVFLLLFSLHTYAQPSEQNSLDSLAGALIQHIRHSEPEQSYITSDKSIYQTGETIWLRAFLLHSFSQTISVKSAIVAELVNEKDSSVKSLLLDAGNQQLTGKIHLPDSLSSGFYWLRAYTVAMTQRDSIQIYSRPVYIINPHKPDPGGRHVQNASTSATGSSINASFLPEGGSIITGTNTVIAFHFTDENGNPVVVSGSIKDNRDSIVARFSSNELGIGKFEFFPYRARRYTATIIENRKEYSYPLPQFNFYAGQLAITDSQKGIKRVRVLLEDSLYKKDYVTYLIGISRDSLCFAGIGRGNYELNIPVSQFPKGIATLFLFNNNNELLSERSFYVQDESLQVTAKPDKPAYGKREKAILALSISDLKNQAVPSSLSISVAAQALIVSEEINALHAAFFQQNDPMIRHWALESDTAFPDSTLQLLMLTKQPSYRPFINKNSANTEIANDSLLYIRGKVLAQKGKSAANKVVTLLAQGQSTVFETATTDLSGRFVFPLNGFADSTHFNIQVSSNGKPENLDIVFDTLTFPRPGGVHSLHHKFDLSPANVSDYAEKWEPSFPGPGKEWLEPVIVKSKRNNDLLYESKRVSSSSFIVPSSSFEKGGYGSVRNSVLRVPGLTINKGYLVVRGLSSTTAVTANAEPLVALNGIVLYLPGGDINGVSPVLNFLNSLNPDDIEFIEVLKGPEGATYGTRGGNGVIVIHTSNTMNVEPEKQSSLKTYYARGYHNPALFPIPNYGIKELKRIPNSDSRSTLYWIGNILTDEKGKVEVPFYTNDVAGVYKVIIKGITVRGDIVYKTVVFTVE